MPKLKFGGVGFELRHVSNFLFLQKKLLKNFMN